MTAPLLCCRHQEQMGANQQQRTDVARAVIGQPPANNQPGSQGGATYAWGPGHGPSEPGGGPGGGAMQQQIDELRAAQAKHDVRLATMRHEAEVCWLDLACCLLGTTTAASGHALANASPHRVAVCIDGAAAERALTQARTAETRCADVLRVRRTAAVLPRSAVSSLPRGLKCPVGPVCENLQRSAAACRPAAEAVEAVAAAAAAVGGKGSQGSSKSRCGFVRSRCVVQAGRCTWATCCSRSR